MPESSKGDEPALVWVKIVVFSMIITLADRLLHATNVEFGLSCVAASLVQALIPPRRTGLVPLLALSGALTLIALLLQWQYHVR